MSRIDTAIKLAAQVHEGQTDKGGEPYILHALAVMNTVDTSGAWINDVEREALLCAAVLHDAVEDYPKAWTKLPSKQEFISLLENTFSAMTVLAIEALTRPSDLPYSHYIELVAEDWVARRVKIADLTHNMDPSRLPVGEISQVDYDRWNKYRKALVRLKREE